MKPNFREMANALRLDINRNRDNLLGGYPVEGSMTDLIEAFLTEAYRAGRAEGLREGAEICSNLNTDGWTFGYRSVGDDLAR